MKSSNKDCALVYAKQGFPVFPLGKYRENDTGEKAKKPACKHGLKDGTTDTTAVAALFTSEDFNVGCATGRRDDGKYLVVVDVDPGHGGDSSWQELIAKYPEIDTATSCVETGTGGRHYYYLSDVEIRNSASVLAPGVDIRGEGGYVVLPPSRHPNGNKYRWLKAPKGKDDYVSFPPPLLALLHSNNGSSKNSQQGQGASRNDRSTKLPPVIEEGTRKTTLFGYACGLVRSYPPDEVGRLVREANEQRCKPPLSVEEIQDILKSAEKKRPADWRKRPKPLRNYWVKVRDEDGKDSPRPLADYDDDLRDQAKFFYRIVDSEGEGAMFLEGYPEDKVTDRHSLYNAFLRIGRVLDFLRPRLGAKIQPETYLDWMQSNCKQYDRIHNCQEYPTDSKTLYLNPAVEPRKTGKLRELCDTITAADERSRYRFCAAILSPFMGRAYDGKRPFMAGVARERSSGKSTLADVASAIVQGAPLVRFKSHRENEDKLGSRLTIGSPFILFDNLTKMKIEEAETIADDITSPRIGTHIMYVSHGSFPNHFTYWATFTDDNVLKGDLLERALIITMTDWAMLGLKEEEIADRKRILSEKLDTFVEQREEVLADIAYVFSTATADHPYIAHPKCAKWSKAMSRLLAVVFPEVDVFDFGISFAERAAFDEEIATFDTVFDSLIPPGRDRQRVSLSELLTEVKRVAEGEHWAKSAIALSRKLRNLIPSLSSKWWIEPYRTGKERGYRIQRWSLNLESATDDRTPKEVSQRDERTAETQAQNADDPEPDPEFRDIENPVNSEGAAESASEARSQIDEFLDSLDYS